MASAIFALAILEFISWKLSHSKPAIIIDKGDGYLLEDYPLLNTIGYLVIAIYFVVKSIRYKACIYSKIISIVYLIIQIVNLSAIFIKYGYVTYNEYVYPLFLCTIIIIIFVKILKWCFQNRY